MPITNLIFNLKKLHIIKRQKAKNFRIPLSQQKLKNNFGIHIQRNFRNNKGDTRMTYFDNHKRNSFDTIMYSDPEHMIFVYSPQVKHLRLMELEKCALVSKDFADNQYNSVQNMHMNGVYGIIQEQSQWLFRPKRCFLLDSQMATIQKQPYGRPISYHRQYTKIFQRQLKKKIFNWFSQTDSLFMQHSLTQQYYHYEEINNFCFGRRHFVRVLNSIQLASDHISRNHCEIAVVRGRGTKEIRKYFDLLFGVGQNDSRGKVMTSSKRTKLSKGNVFMFIPMQLWYKIYEYVFLTRDKYYLLDSGSRNGSFFIECPISNRSQQNTPFEYNMYGNKIDINHKILIREGFSYEYQGEQYLMKVWRLTHDKMKLTQEQQSTYTTTVQQLIHQQFPLYTHNQKTIKNVQQFEQKINWFNNFQKVSKDYIIDQSLLKRYLWKGKKVYEDMIKDNFHKPKSLESPKRNSSSRTDIRRSESYEEQDIFGDMDDSNRPNESYEPFSLLPPNPTSPENQQITKAEFVRLIYQEFLLMQKILKNLSNQQQSNKSQTKPQQVSKTYQVHPQWQHLKIQFSNKRKQSTHSQCSQQLKWKQAQQFFISEHNLNAMVISLDFNNDFKKLYCIITETKKPKKFHIGSQMIINTARFEFDDQSKCNGYIEFDGKNWFVVALKPRNQFLPNNNFAHRNKKVVSGSLTDSQEDSDKEDGQDNMDKDKERQDKLSKGKNQKEKCLGGFFQGTSKTKHQKNPINDIHKNKLPKEGKKINLQKQISCKIWTKIPSMSQFQLNPLKCSRYILRLAHAFYFELKFLNFTSPSSETYHQADEIKP